MHDIIAFLKDAVDRGPTAGINGCYIVRDGSIYARNMMMIAGIAMPSEVDFSVPAAAFDAALARMKTIQSMTVEDNTVTVKAGRLKSSIKLHYDEPVPIPVMPEEMLHCPAGLAESLRLAIPFLGDMGWSTGICLLDQRVIAFSNKAGIEVELPGLQCDPPILLTRDVAQFIVDQGDPDEYAADERKLCLRWNDGRWMVAQLLNDKMPVEKVSEILENATTEAPMVPITQEWREAYADAAALSEDHVRITPEGFQGVMSADNTTVSEVDFPMEDLPDGHASYWKAKDIEAAVACAQLWNFDSYPNPSLFLGPGFRGVVMGISRR